MSRIDELKWVASGTVFIPKLHSTIWKSATWTCSVYRQEVNQFRSTLSLVFLDGNNLSTCKRISHQIQHATQSRTDIDFRVIKPCINFSIIFFSNRIDERIELRNIIGKIKWDDADNLHFWIRYRSVRCWISRPISGLDKAF